VFAPVDSEWYLAFQDSHSVQEPIANYEKSISETIGTSLCFRL
jgi:hypothetical protein